jgi:hypothetical protein
MTIMDFGAVAGAVCFLGLIGYFVYWQIKKN